MTKEELKTIDFSDASVVKTVTFRVQKWDGNKPGSKAHMEDFDVPVVQGMTVLDGLFYIKEHLDNTLSYRASCRMGVCGSCGMFINGKPILACQTQIIELETELIEIKPLPNYSVVKDLVPDLTPLISKHKSIKPYIIRKETPPEKITGEFQQYEEELVEYLQFSYCLKCGLCLSACPTVSSLPEFTGPQALAQAFRYTNDSRDEGFDERCSVIDNEFGIFRCHFAGACSEACPKGIDPAFAIQMMKKEIVKRKILCKSGKKGAPILPEKQENPIKKDVPVAPEKTVK